jgi:hypothetical protein
MSEDRTFSRDCCASNQFRTCAGDHDNSSDAFNVGFASLALELADVVGVEWRDDATPTMAAVMAAMLATRALCAQTHT